MLISKKEPLLDVRHQAFLFQIQAVQAVKDLPYAALFHEQGLGKSKIGIDLALMWLKDKVVDSVIIVTKRGLIKNWSEEVKNHTFFQARILNQDHVANFEALNSPSRLYLCHYEVIKSEQKRLELFLKTRRVGVILDEAQKIKNPDADVTKALFRLAPAFARRVIMTGTPVANRPYDIWSQIFFLDQGHALGADFEEFKSKSDLTNSLASSASEVDRFEETIGTIYTRISSFAIRETKKSAGINLPEKHVENLTVDMEPQQQSLYDKYRTELRAEVFQDGHVIVDDAEDILKRLLRLVQIASNPMLVDSSYRCVPGKLAKARELVVRAIEEGSKAIVWTAFIDSAAWLTKEFSSYGAVCVSGAKSLEDRNSALDSFKHSAACKVLVATPGAAKEGHTLTVANHAIFFDRSFSLDDYLQAQDRIHRISQTRVCHIWNLLARGSIDEWVDMLLAAKQLAAQFSQGDIDRSEYNSKSSYEFGNAIRAILQVPAARSTSDD